MAPRCFLRRDRFNGREMVVESLVKLNEWLVGRAIRTYLKSEQIRSRRGLGFQIDFQHKVFFRNTVWLVESQ
jgi:hypothetical protein